MRTSNTAWRMISRLGWRGPLVVLAMVLTGCGQDDGPPRYSLSGTVTYEGQPVPFGWMVFSPAQGPGATANIEDGKYHTPPGWGTVGGPHTIEVVAFGKKPDPKAATEGGAAGASQPTLTCTLQRDIPKEATTWDIKITPDDLR